MYMTYMYMYMYHLHYTEADLMHPPLNSGFRPHIHVHVDVHDIAQGRTTETKNLSRYSEFRVFEHETRKHSSDERSSDVCFRVSRNSE